MRAVPLSALPVDCPVLIARAPVRISLAGGGTDMPSYYREFGGMVVSTTIDKYFYVFVNLNGAESVQITSSDYRTFFRQQHGEPLEYDGELTLPRAFLHQFGIDAGISLFTASEVPPGTGLGSSSTVAVALAKALSTLCRLHLDDYQIAELAAYVEISKLQMPIGRQDQYAAAFGGLNTIHFGPGTGVRVEPINLQPDVERALERRLMLFFTGGSRSAASILKSQHESTQRKDGDVLRSLDHIKEAATKAVMLLKAGDLDEFGALLHDAWQVKKGLASGISSPEIDRAYETALAHGAMGGKITGAGGGGFLLLYCHEDRQLSVTRALGNLGLMRTDFHFERSGAVVLMDAIPRIRRIGSPEHAMDGVATAGAGTSATAPRPVAA